MLITSQMSYISNAVKALPARRGICNSVRNHSAFLAVGALDVNQIARSRIVVRHESSGDCELLGGVDSVLRSGAVVLRFTQGVWVEAASPLVTDSLEATVARPVAASAGADTVNTARVGCESSRTSIGLPDVHFIAAGSQNTVVDSAVEERQFGALGVAVAGAVCSAGVGGTLSARHSHLRQVQGAVHTAGKSRQLDVEGELLVGKLHALVLLAVRVKEVYSW